MNTIFHFVAPLQELSVELPKAIASRFSGLSDDFATASF